MPRIQLAAVAVAALAAASPALAETSLDEAGFASLRSLRVPPLQPGETLDDVAHLVSLGRVRTGPAESLIVTLTGTFAGQAPRGGEVGLILVPDVPTVRRALEEDRRPLLARRIRVEVEPMPSRRGEAATDRADRWFGATSRPMALAFTDWLAWAYNDTPQAITLDVHWRGLSCPPVVADGE